MSVEIPRDWKDSWVRNWNGDWYFYDPYNEQFGPYETEADAKEALAKYAETFDEL